MNIYLIELHKDTPTIYDAYYGHVIAANSEMDVRQMASKKSCDEGKEVWLNPPKSPCRIIGKEYIESFEPAIILSSFNAG